MKVIIDYENKKIIILGETDWTIEYVDQKFYDYLLFRDGSYSQLSENQSDDNISSTINVEDIE